MRSKVKATGRQAYPERPFWLGGYWERWLRRRLPAVDQVRFGRRNLFIFPVREGVVFLTLLVIMLLTGINYQNSLIYLLTFLLGALFYLGILQTHDNLSGVELALTRLGEGFAGHPQSVTLRVCAPGARLALKISAPGATAPGATAPGSAAPGSAAPGATSTVNLQSDTSEEVEISFSPRQRGLVPVPRILVETRYPMGMFRAWSYLWLKTPMLVYPRPIQPALPLQSNGSDEEGQRAPVTRLPSDELQLRPYRRGDPLQRVQWKRYGKDGQMVVMEREATGAENHWLDYDDFPGADQELRLSYLAWLVEEAHAQGQVFGLRLPGTLLPSGEGEVHRREALRCLALFRAVAP